MGFGAKILNKLVLRGSAVIVATALLAPALFARSVHAECAPDTIALRGSWGQAQFSVELADDHLERAQGLMHREVLATSAGMLFVYPRPHRASFWMKNTLIPLDLIFIDENSVVTRVHENAIPLDLTQIDGGDGVIAVLEINGGLARAMGIAIGTSVQHPEFDQKLSVWPCQGQ